MIGEAMAHWGLSRKKQTGIITRVFVQCDHRSNFGEGGGKGNQMTLHYFFDLRIFFFLPTELEGQIKKIGVDVGGRCVCVCVCVF